MIVAAAAAVTVLSLFAAGIAAAADRMGKMGTAHPSSPQTLEIYGTEAMVYGNFGEAYFRMAMTAGVATGTTEVNLNLVASRFLRLPRE